MTKDLLELIRCPITNKSLSLYKIEHSSDSKGNEYVIYKHHLAASGDTHRWMDNNIPSEVINSCKNHKKKTL